MRGFLRTLLITALVLSVSTITVASAANSLFAPTSPSEPELDRIQDPEISPAPEATPLPTPDPEPEPRPAPVQRDERPEVTRTEVPAKPRPSPSGTPKPQPAPAPSGGPGNYTALLVGINNAPGSKPLKGSITDANNTRDMLVKSGFKKQNIVKLTDGHATRGNILAELDRLAARTSGKGYAVFMLATHSGYSGGRLTFATGGGGRISNHELASKLGRVRGKLVSLLPTCYSGGYAISGITGKNRIAVLSSDADEYTYQLGSAGSWLILYMVDYGILRGQSKAESFEAAYKWAKKKISEQNPDRAPWIKDGVSGDLALSTS